MVDGGDAIVGELRQHGLDMLFTLPGAQIDGLSDALARKGAIPVIGARDEQACGYVAFGNVRRDQEQRFGGRVVTADLVNPGFGGRVVTADLVNPDFMTLAESFGIPGARAANPSGLRRMWKWPWSGVDPG